MASLASRPRSLATVTFMRERAHASNNGGASPVRRRLTYRGRWPPGRPAAPPSIQGFGRGSKATTRRGSGRRAMIQSLESVSGELFQDGGGDWSSLRMMMTGG